MHQHAAEGDSAGIPYNGFGIPRVIEAIGTGQFGEELLSLLYERSGADHCSVFEVGSDRLEWLASASLDGTDTASHQCTLYVQGRHWQRDPVLAEARHCTRAGGAKVMRIDIADLPMGEFRDVIYGTPGIKERVTICGQRDHGAFGVSVLRTGRRGPFSDSEVASLQGMADTLISALAKHAEIVHRPLQKPNLKCLTAIQAKIAASPDALARREADVCARILYGLSTTGIALDIGIGEESVVTYRKRAFQRLGIATRRELLLWYLDL